MIARREFAAFAIGLAAILGVFFQASLFGGKILSSGDVVFATASFAEFRGAADDYEPTNRLLMDPVLQFRPWLEFARDEIRAGRLPLWNPYAGCGAPFLANGQSAVFDPFHAIAYLGRLPDALAWMAAARLWVAGIGMYLLAKAWRLSAWGRWTSGLSYPFSGFLIGWLLYPIGSVAVWMPWVFLATDKALEGPGTRGIAGLALAVGVLMLGGQVQAAAHILLAAGSYVTWRGIVEFRVSLRMGSGWWAKPTRRDVRGRSFAGPLGRWTLGVILGIGIGAVAILPLACYLTRSQVWADRRAEHPSVLAIAKPRALDAVTTALPYAFGSQRRGHPNLARALGVHNLNESAGGFVGLATLIWLAPAAWGTRRERPRVRFLVGLALVGATGAFEVFPTINVLRALPVLEVADHRRLTLWVAFALSLLGGIGIDRIDLALRGKLGRAWVACWAIAALAMAAGAVGIKAAGPTIRERAIAHYEAAARETIGVGSSAFRARAERQAKQATEFLPRYYVIAAGHLLALCGLWRVAGKRGLGRPSPARVDLAKGVVFALAMADRLAFGYGLNPEISRDADRPVSAVIASLRKEALPPLRVLAIGAELPPNLLMNYGLADVRNYDSIELSRSLAWFEPLYEPEPGRPVHSSRRTILWDGVLRAIDRLRVARVAAIVSATPPPAVAFARVDRVGRTWIARLDFESSDLLRAAPGEIRIDLRGHRGQVRSVAETFDPGWKAEVDGRPVRVEPRLGTFLSARWSGQGSQLIFRYDPLEVRIGVVASLASLVFVMAFAGLEIASISRPLGLERRLGAG